MEVNRRFLRHLYDAYRTERMNQLYYGWRLHRVRRWNRSLEFAIAVSSSTAIAAWGLWQLEGWKVAWQVVGGIGALTALAKPIVNLGKRIERYGRLYAGHGDVCFDLYRLVEEIAEIRGTRDEHRKTYDACFARIRQLTPDDDPIPDDTLLRRAYAQVQREIPARELWMPGKGA